MFPQCGCAYPLYARTAWTTDWSRQGRTIVDNPYRCMRADDLWRQGPRMIMAVSGSCPQEQNRWDGSWIPGPASLLQPLLRVPGTIYYASDFSSGTCLSKGGQSLRHEGWKKLSPCFNTYPHGRLPNTLYAIWSTTWHDETTYSRILFICCDLFYDG